MLAGWLLVMLAGWLGMLPGMLAGYAAWYAGWLCWLDMLPGMLADMLTGYAAWYGCCCGASWRMGGSGSAGWYLIITNKVSLSTSIEKMKGG